MNFFSEKKRTNLIIALLVILNLVILGTFWYKHVNSTNDNSKFTLPQQGTDIQVPPRGKNPGRPGFLRFLRNELKFSKVQVKRFMSLSKNHFLKAEKIKFQTESIRRQIMDQLMSENTKHQETRALAEQIGNLAAQHEIMVYTHFKDLMNICNPDQLKKYKHLFLGIFRQLYPPKNKPPRNMPPPSENPDLNHLHKKNLPGHLNQKTITLNNQLQRLDRELLLSDDQIQKIRKILKSEFNENGRLKLRSMPPPERRKLKDREDQKILKVLTPSQQDKFLKFLERTKRKQI